MRIESPVRRCLWFSILLFVLGILTVCSDPAGSNSMGEREMSPQNIQKVLETHNQELLSIPGVVGTAESLCEGKPCIQVMVSEKTPSLEQRILSTLDGYPVRITETGSVRPRPSE